MEPFITPSVTMYRKEYFAYICIMQIERGDKMKFIRETKRIKIVAVVMLALALVIPGVLSMRSVDTGASEADGNPSYDVAAIHNISRNDGGGAYGTHTYPSYVENGVQYYRSGDIIELDVQLPKEHGSVMFSEAVKFDNTKVELLSGFNDIRASMAPNLSQKGWFSSVDKLNGATNQILIAGGADDYTNDANEWKGGTIAKMYFRVLPNVDTETGTNITFEFPQFQTISYANGKLVYTHRGYDANNDLATAYYKADPVTIVAKKPATVVNPPVLDLKNSAVTIYEGDLFDPTGYISACSDPLDGTITKDSVSITEGTGKFTKHQPVAGTYTFKYSVTSTSGMSTEKTLALTVSPRTYAVASVSVADKKISLPVGTTSKELEAEIDKVKAQDFSVTISCNDGTSFKVPGKVVSGKTDRYLVDEKDKLIAQDFNVTYKVAMPSISYSTDGSRIVNPYNGNPSFVSNVTPAQAEAKVAISISGSNGNNNNNNNGGGNANAGSGGKSAASTSPTNGTSTGDTTNMSLMIALVAGSLIVLSGYKIKKQLDK